MEGTNRTFIYLSRGSLGLEHPNSSNFAPNYQINPVKDNFWEEGTPNTLIALVEVNRYRYLNSLPKLLLPRVAEFYLAVRVN